MPSHIVADFPMCFQRLRGAFAAQDGGCVGLELDYHMVAISPTA
jgi:hypothetical protein